MAAQGVLGSSQELTRGNQETPGRQLRIQDCLVLLDGSDDLIHSQADLPPQVPSLGCDPAVVTQGGT